MEKFYKRPALTAGIIAVVTIFFAAQLPGIRLDNNNMRFLPKGNHARVLSEYIDDEFGGQVAILVGLERPFSTVFDPAFLARVRDYSNAVEMMDLVKDVNSIMSTQYITGDSESIIVDDLVSPYFSGSPEEIAELKRRIASWDLFQGALVSNDFQATQILVTLDVTTDEQASPEVNAAFFKIREMAHEMFEGAAEVYVTGMPAINATITESMIADTILLIPLVLVAVLLVLFISFRRFIFVTLPMLTVIVSVVWAAGLMALLGIQFSILSTILPVILVAVGSAYGIHVITHYIGDYRNRVLTDDEHRVLVFDLMRKLRRPLFLAAITTSAGFISFCFTPIVPMKEFGIFGFTGVIASLIVTATLIPSLLLIRGNRGIKTKNTGEGTADRFSNTIGNFFLTIARRKRLILCCTALVIALSVYGLSQIIVDNVLVEYFQNETDISRSDRFIRERFGGSKELVLVVEADTTEELLSPAVLSAVDNLAAFLVERVPEVGKVIGFTDIIKRMNQVFNVDQSPDGIGNAGSKDPGEQRTVNNDAFGFDDSFGFGFDASDDFGFGFDDFGFGSDFADTAGVETVYAPAAINGGLHDYSVMDLITLLDTASGNNTAMNGNDLVRELKRLVNYEGFSYYEIPTDSARYGKSTPEELQAIVSDYLVLLAGDDSMAYSNDPLEPTSFKTTIQLRTVGNRDTNVIVDLIRAYIDANFPKNVQVLIGGGAIQEGAITDLIVNSQIISIAVSVLIVYIIIAFFYKSFSAGLVGAIPVAIAILCNFAVMGFVGIKLNIGTAIIASLALGIGTDYTIHFIESFRREYAARQGEGDDFLRKTFISCGKAIIINALSVSAGFVILAFSRFRIIAEVGTLVAFSMIITALVGLVIIPALITAIKPKFIYGGEK